MEIKMMKLEDIDEDEPFANLFLFDQDKWNKIRMHMAEFGYDHTQPLIIWKEKRILLDGHHRLAAAEAQVTKYLGHEVKAEFQTLPIVEKSFASEEEAIEYVIHLHTERRNLTDSDILNLVEKVDKLYLDKWGGKREKASFGTQKLDSRNKTADIVGISKDKVSQCRHILENCDLKTIQTVTRGEKTIYNVYSASINYLKKMKILEQKIEEYQKGKQSKASLKEVIQSKAILKHFDDGEDTQDLEQLRYLLSMLLKRDPILAKIKRIVQSLKKNDETFKDLLEETDIQKFLTGSFVSDFVTILELFGYKDEKKISVTNRISNRRRKQVQTETR
jgi:ParB family chromosome partitioning protein